MTSPERIAEAWKLAAAELGLSFATPYEVEEGGKKIRYVGLVQDFGCKNGMLIFVSDKFETEPWAGVAKKNGFGYSCLSKHYESYNRSEFIATLDDWGWSPKDRPPPAWYTGTPWGHLTKITKPLR